MEYFSEEGERGKFVLDKYKSLIDNGSKSFSLGRNVFQKWSAVKIFIFSTRKIFSY